MDIPQATKVFDVVTYSGSASTQNIAHNLGSVPGCIIVKRTSGVEDWFVYHTSLGNTQYIKLNTTGAVASGFSPWNNTSPTSTQFTVLGGRTEVNAAGSTYVAYLFAHNAGGFGLTGTDNVISCGSYSGSTTVSLGYEPQWILTKDSASVDNWYILDCQRQMTISSAGGVGTDSVLFPNTSGAETTATKITPTSTGFITQDSAGPHIYIAIRRGLMKVPTDATKVFAPVAYTGTNVDNRLVNTGIVTDMTMARIRTATSTGSFYTSDRLRGNASLGTAIADAENTDADSFMTPTVGYGGPFSAMNGFGVGNDVTRQLNQSSTAQLAYAFQRASGFFDEVCYTGTGSARTVSHNLGVVPEMMIVKKRSNTGDWPIYQAALGATKMIELNSAGAASVSSTRWNDTAPTASVFTVGTHTSVNASGDTYVAYLFATCAGVSKVGSYTGTGTTKQIDCGFTSGSRFVMIKRTDSPAVGDWYVWDSARGIVSGNDPYMFLNSTAAEVTNTDYVDTYSAGFEISSTAPAEINANGGTFIFLAIA